MVPGAEYLGFLNADCLAEGLDSSGERVSQTLQVLVGVSSQCTIVCEQEVADQSFLHFGVGFQSSQIEEARITSAADHGASISLGERRGQHLSEK